MVFPLSDVDAPSSDTVRLRQAGINFYVGNDHLGNGDLYIGENEFSWIRSDGHGISLDYPSISLHAISKDESSFVHPCLYLMVHNQSNGNGIENAETESQDEDESEDGIVEMRFVPEDPSVLEEMFKIVSTCQALHPDPADSMSDSENGDNLFANLCENFNPPSHQASAGGDGNDHDNDDEDEDESPFHMEAGPGEYEDAEDG
ncbi:chloride nucleotide-sensitive channel icln [Brevipalpus obovatus]|uniref:chloride nucleotide-sensitive channel icln n=1 Tax=Brevipalpus obovatus TaxID=246614 RepID=UPI003D9F2C0D